VLPGCGVSGPHYNNTVCVQDLQKRVKAEIASINNAKKKDRAAAKDRGDQAEQAMVQRHKQELAQLLQLQQADSDGSGDSDGDEKQDTAASEDKLVVNVTHLCIAIYTPLH